MFYFDMDEVIDEDFITKIVNKFNLEMVGYYQMLDRYYEVKNDGIAKRFMKGKKPDNKLFHGFARYITNMATSYFAGKPIEYMVEDEGYKKELMPYLDDTYNFDYEISKEASKKGIAYELLYVTEKSELRSRQYGAEEIIPIYSASPDEFLNGFIKLSAIYNLDGYLKKERAAVYDKTDIYEFERSTGNGRFSLVDIRKHYLNDVPLIVYWNTQEMNSDYEGVISLIDAYDRAESNTANDMDYFTDAYLLIKGAEGGLVDEDGEDILLSDSDEALKNKRIMYLDEKGDAKFLEKDGDNSSIEEFKNRVFKDIFFVSQVPALTDESFAGDLSGIAIKYKLIGLEQLAIMKENRMRLAKAKKISMITEWINWKKSKNYDASTVKQKYTRNFTENVSEIIDNVTKLTGVVSKRTQLDMLPKEIIADTNKELETIDEELKESEGLFMESV
nr:MAG TPA: PORTAL PROTEIN [Caudoviricetes sp.]